MASGIPFSVLMEIMRDISKEEAEKRNLMYFLPLLYVVPTVACSFLVFAKLLVQKSAVGRGFGGIVSLAMFVTCGNLIFHYVTARATGVPAVNQYFKYLRTQKNMWTAFHFFDQHFGMLQSLTMAVFALNRFSVVCFPGGAYFWRRHVGKLILIVLWLPLVVSWQIIYCLVDVKIISKSIVQIGIPEKCISYPSPDIGGVYVNFVFGGLMMLLWVVYLLVWACKGIVSVTGEKTADPDECLSRERRQTGYAAVVILCRVVYLVLLLITLVNAYDIKTYQDYLFVAQLGTIMQFYSDFCYLTEVWLCVFAVKGAMTSCTCCVPPETEIQYIKPERRAPLY